MVSKNATRGGWPIKTKVYVSAMVVLFLCLIGWTGHAEAQRSSQERRTWEYKVFSPVTPGPSLQDQMNQLGAEGWELVTVQQPLIYCFKRAR